MEDLEETQSPFIKIFLILIMNVETHNNQLK